MMYDYPGKKQTILNDNMLSDVGKRLQLSTLQQKTLEDLKNEQSSLEERKKANHAQLVELRKSKYHRPLPTVLVQKLDYLADTDKYLINLLAQSVALQAEQRAGERLVARLAMAEDEAEYMRILGDALYENPSAVVRVFPIVQESARNRFSDSVLSHLNRQLNDIYSNALTLEMDSSEKKWQEENALKLKQLQERQMAILSEEIQISGRIHDIQNEIVGTEAKDYYFNGGQLEANQTTSYFKKQL